MTNNDIIRMAREAGFDPRYCSEDFSIHKFAELVRADEREACAKVCDELDAMNWSESGEYSSGYGDEIRKRGKQ